MSRDWTEAERAILRQSPKVRPTHRKLTDDQVREIRERVDSLTVPWTLNGLAHEYGVTTRQISAIARREDFAERAYEPSGREYWKARELREMEQARLDRARRQEADNRARKQYKEFHER